MTNSAFNNPRKIVCIYCQYERAFDDRISVCPECGKSGLVYHLHLAPRLRRLRVYVWGELLMCGFLVATVIIMLLPRPILMLGAVFPLLLIAATVQGFIGIFISGATFDRKGLHRNSSLRKYTWIGMTLSVLLFCSIGITIMGSLMFF